MKTTVRPARARRAAPFLPALLVLAASSPSVVADSAATTAATGETLFYATRDDIPRQDRWDLAAIFPDRAAWDTARAEVEADLPALASFRGHLAESPRVLADAIANSFAISRKLEGVYVYAFESLHTQTGDPAAQEPSSTAQALAARVQEAAAFIDPEIVRIPRERLAGLLEDPALAPWLHYVDNVVRTREHILSPEIEEILAGSSLFGAQFQEAYSSLQDSDIEWPTVEKDGQTLGVVPGQYTRFVTDSDRALRRDASLALFGTYDSGAHAMAESGRPLTRESLGKSYSGLWKDYYGPALVDDDVYSAGWARVSHYRSFYVWAYATSYAAGEALAQRFRNGDRTAVDDYLAMLRLGGSVYPMDALGGAGVDMNDPKVIGAVMDRYGALQKRGTEMRPSP